MLLADAAVASMASAPATSRFGNVRGEVGGNGGVDGPERPIHDGPARVAGPLLEEDA